MSTPFPLEEQQQASDDLSPRVNPWNRNPEPGFFTGLGLSEDNAYLGPLYHLAAIPGAGGAAGEYVLAGGLGKMTHPLAELSDWIATNVHGRAGTPDTDAQERFIEAMKQDALERLKALRPDLATPNANCSRALGRWPTTDEQIGPTSVPPWRATFIDCSTSTAARA